MSYQTHFAVSLSLTSLTTILLGIFVFASKRESQLGKIFFLYCLSISWWSFFQIIHMTSAEEDRALLWAQVMEAGAFFIPTFYIHFIRTFLNLKTARPILAIVYLLSTIFAALSFTPYMISGAGPKFYFSAVMVPGPLYSLAVIFFVILVAYGSLLLFRSYINSDGIKRTQLGYLFWSSLVGYMGGSANFLYVFDVNVPIAIPIFGTYAIPLYVGITAFTIIKHQLMDIRTVIHKTAMWTVTSSLYVIPIGLVLFATKPQIDKLPLWLFLMMIAALFLLNIPYMRIVQPKIDHLFQRRLYDLRSILDRFIRDVAIVKSIPELSEKLVGTIRRVLYAEPTTLLVWHPREALYAATDGSIGIPDDDAWLVWLGGRKQMVELSEVSAGPDRAAAEAARAYAARTHALFCLPLHRDGLLVGVVNIGPKRNLQRYSQPEREFLETLRAEASIALTNSLLYDDVTQMSEELRQWGLQLEHKVEERTQELQTAMRKLKETESQLIQSEKLSAHGLLAAGVLHEINNPLSFSRGSLSVLRRALDRVKDASRGAMDPLLAEVERAAEIIQNGHERIATIVRDLKMFAKRDVEGIKLNDLHQGLDATLSLLRHELGDRITVVKDYGDIGLAEVDSAQINQVFLNLLHNAMQSIPGSGTITIKSWLEGDRVFISIKDTGTGIEPEHLPRIFEPFFTTKPVGQGTGLGLSVSHRIVAEHSGQMTVQSVPGRGTEFVIELPVRQTVATHAVR
jgi:signal transduction histidine kinase